MSLVSSRLSLTHRCTVERDANLGQVDADGYPLTPDWQTSLTDQPCRLWATSGRETVTDKTTLVVVEDLRLLLPLGTVVLVTDRLGDVTYRGDTILAGPTSIRGVLHHQDHTEIVLTRIA